MNTQEIIDFYLLGNSLAETSRVFNKTAYMIKQILNENDVKIRSRKEQNILTNMSRAKSVNQDYFDKIEENQAFLLGFYAADGSVSKSNNKIKLGLSSVDIGILEKIKEEMKIERNIYSSTTSNGFDISELTFSSMKIKNRFKDFGIVSNKTYIGKISMSNIPNEYKKDFIRGYFDGDGTITSNKDTYMKFSICSNKKEILLEMRDFIYASIGVSLNLYENKRQNSILFTIEKTGLEAEKIMEFLYDTKGTIFLERKREKYFLLKAKRQKHL